MNAQQLLLEIETIQEKFAIRCPACAVRLPRASKIPAHRTCPKCKTRYTLHKSISGVILTKIGS